MSNAHKIFVMGTLACLILLCAIWCSTTTESNASSVSLVRHDNMIAPAVYKQDVDHFSNDARAMSPRDWGSIEPYIESAPSIPLQQSPPSIPLQQSPPSITTHQQQSPLSLPHQQSAPSITLQPAPSNVPLHQASSSVIIQPSNSGIAIQQQPNINFDQTQNTLPPPPFDDNSFESQFAEPQPVELQNPFRSEETRNQFRSEEPRNPFRPAESGNTYVPKYHYENQPLEIGEGDFEAHSSPLPLQTDEKQLPKPQTPKKPVTPKKPAAPKPAEKSAVKPPTEDAIPAPQIEEKQQPIESRIEPYQGPIHSQGIAVAPTYDMMVHGQNQTEYIQQFGVQGCGNQSCSECSTGNVSGNVGTTHGNGCAMMPGRRQGMIRPRQYNGGRMLGQRRSASPGHCDSCQGGFQGGFQGNSNFGSNFMMSRGNRHQSVQQPGFFGHGEINQVGCGPTPTPSSNVMQYNPALGFRSDCVGDRFNESSATVFPFEKDEQFPSMREILANSVYFAEFDFLLLQPSFGGNTAISSGAGGVLTADPFNFDLEPAFRVAAGYESDFGPGFVLDYFQFDNNSDLASFTIDGTSVGEASVFQLGANALTTLGAFNAGETLNASHSLELHSTSVQAFKAINFARASVTGRFGLQLTSIRQDLEANVTGAGGGVLSRLTGTTEVNAFGPRFGIDYKRRVGHTPLQLISSATGALLFGDRDQNVTNSLTGEASSVGADEFITHIDIFFGLQMRRYRGEKRNTAMRLGFVNQSWIGGGTAIDPNDDFGFQGVSFTLGLNR